LSLWSGHALCVALATSDNSDRCWPITKVMPVKKDSECADSTRVTFAGPQILNMQLISRFKHSLAWLSLVRPVLIRYS
jgi:hypothetical protein